MSKPVTLVLWRDAKTDPPPCDEMAYLTHVNEEGFAYSAVCTYLGSEDIYGDIVGYAWYYGDSGDPATPQPDLWADAPPPGDDPLTVDDLRTILQWAEIAHRNYEDRRPRPHFNEHIEEELQEQALAREQAFARLRRALDALEEA